ncbi:MAG: DUF2167 domain-containing protein [Nitrospira sp.]
MKRSIISVFACLLGLFWLAGTHGSVEAQETEKSAPTYAWQKGPLDAKLGEQATLKLTEDYVFLGPQETQRILKDMGNFPSGEELGLVAGGSGDEDWFMVIRFIDAGYVPDDDAANWNAEEMLASLKEGTEASNAKRREMGIDTLTVRGWEEKPHYDKASNKVVWAISADGSHGTSVNYNTLALGRHGYMSMNLVSGLEQLSGLKPHTAALLANLNFVEGKRYADFNSATDKVAAVGLAALVAGAAFKSGLLAKLLVLIIAFKKAILIGAAGIGTWAWKVFKGRSSANPSA